MSGNTRQRQIGRKEQARCHPAHLVPRASLNKPPPASLDPAFFLPSSNCAARFSHLHFFLPLMSSDSATESDADTATCSSSLSDGSSSSSDDETHVRVHWGRVEVSTEGRFLHKVRRRDSREFHRRKTMGPDADDWCKDRIPRGVGDDGHNEESEEPKQGARSFVEGGRIETYLSFCRGIPSGASL